MLMPTWGHKRLVWNPVDVLWRASVELYSNTVSISQYKYDSPLHIGTSCIEQQHHLHTQHISQSGDRPMHIVRCSALLGSSKYVIRSHQEERQETFCKFNQSQLFLGEKGFVRVSLSVIVKFRTELLNIPRYLKWYPQMSYSC